MPSTLPLQAIDHVAVTVSDIDKALAWYKEVLGAEPRKAAYEVDGKILVISIVAGGVMLNLHAKGNGVWLVAKEPTPGSVDIAFRWTKTVEEAADYLNSKNIEIVAGPITTRCSNGEMSRSVYFRDLDGNLLEFLTTIGVPDGAELGR